MPVRRSRSASRRQVGDVRDRLQDVLEQSRERRERLRLLGVIAVLVINRFDAADGVTEDALGVLPLYARAGSSECAPCVSGRAVASEAARVLIERQLRLAEAAEMRPPSSRGEDVGVRREARAVSDNLDRHRGEESSPALPFLRFSVGSFHRPSIDTSAHFIATTFSRRCPVSNSSLMRSPNVSPGGGPSHTARSSSSSRTPDPRRGILSYTVSLAARIRIAAIEEIGLIGVTRTFHDVPGSFPSSVRTGIVDPRPSANVVAYELVAIGEDGTAVRRRLDFRYRRAAFDLLPPVSHIRGTGPPPRETDTSPMRTLSMSPLSAVHSGSIVRSEARLAGRAPRTFSKHALATNG